MLDQLRLLDVMNGKTGIGGKNKKDMADHKFWATQPVLQLNERELCFFLGLDLGSYQTVFSQRMQASKKAR